MDLRRADLGLLVSLDVLLEEQSVTAAARRLGISQPALSAQLARLRQTLKDDLLVGNAHGMSLTPRAQEIRVPLHSLLDQLNELVVGGSRFDPLNDARTVRLAAADLAHVVILPRLYAALAEQAPHIVVEAVPLSVDRVAEQMERGKVDLAVTSVENAPRDYPGRSLVIQDYVVIWREGHPSMRPTLSPETFCEPQHLVVSIEGGGIMGEVDASLAQRGLKRRIVGTLPNFLLAPHVVRQTDYVAVVPEAVAQIDGAGLRSAPVPVETSRLAVYLSWHPRCRNDAAHKWLRGLIVDMVAA